MNSAKKFLPIRPAILLPKINRSTFIICRT